MEVEQILEEVKLEDKSEVLREWYDGYVFGDMEIYCPWDVMNYVGDLLFDTISYHDYKESYYHAFLAGLMSAAGYAVKSNYEYGLGRSDIVVKNRKTRSAIVIEAKAVEKAEKMGKGCDEALLQIQNRQYARQLEMEGFQNIICYGVTFFQKQCMVKML